jgi:hypothetical protein
MPKGGNKLPISTAGDNELWKYPQNIKKKNIISEIIKRTIPLVNILTTEEV